MLLLFCRPVAAFPCRSLLRRDDSLAKALCMTVHLYLRRFYKFWYYPSKYFILPICIHTNSGYKIFRCLPSKHFTSDAVVF